LPIAAAVLFSDLEPHEPEHDAALKLWDDRLIGVPVLDLLVVCPQSVRPKSWKPPRRGVLWVEELAAPHLVSHADVVVVSDLRLPSAVAIESAIDVHFRQGHSATFFCAEGPPSRVSERAKSWFSVPLPANLRMILWNSKAFNQVLSGSPLSVRESVKEIPLPYLADLKSNSPAKRAAVFLDRDGTMIEDADYLRDPEKIRIFPETSAALRRLRDAGYFCVIVSNQSGVGRGMFSEQTMWLVHRVLQEQLADRGVTLDGAYYSTAAPSSDDPNALWDRKPNPGMLQRAAADLRIDLGSSWMIGDSARDLIAGQRVGCKGCLFLESGKVQSSDDLEVCRTYTGVPNLEIAADIIQRAR
jgi:D-glycero-D-manno-heptose 1,7-bisphosphate phosphatase